MQRSENTRVSECVAHVGALRNSIRVLVFLSIAVAVMTTAHWLIKLGFVS